MGFWFFLSVVIVGNLALKAYKLRMLASDRLGPHKAAVMQQQINELREQLANRGDVDKRLEQLEETVFFSDFELKKKFSKLESERS
jgi:hypothetical protein